MPNLRMLRHRQILQDSTGSNDTILQMLHAETFQVLRFKMFQQFLTGGGFRKYPVVKLEREELTAEITLKHQAFATLKKNLLWSEVVQQLVYIIKRPFGSKKFAGRDIEKGNATGSLSEMNGSQEVVPLVVQHIVIDRDTGSHQFGNTAFHQLLCHFGVFQLVADSDTFSGTNQFRQICIESMMGESRHLNSFSFSVSAFCQCDS